MADDKTPIESLSGEVKDYIDLKVDDLKLKATKGLSVSLARLLAAFVILFSLLLVILTLAVAFILLLGKASGDYALGALIALGVFVAVLVVLYLLRKRLFTGTFVKMFIQIFFPENEA